MATKKTNTEEQVVTKVVLKDPRITEKAANGAQYSIYLFNVAVGATKSEIAKAFQAKYNKKPVKVNTVNTLPKTYFRRGKLGTGSAGKKAYVFLPKGVTIDVI
jgi:ribosomal protein L23